MSKNIKILVVDDNQINRQYFSMALNKFGFKVTLANDGFEAIELAEKSQFDLVFMDIRMPVIDGYDTTAKIRQFSHHKSTPILAISAENMLVGKGHVFNGFILKPASPKLLKSTVENYCNTKEQTTVVFDEEKALKFAYNDKEIMGKLIALFLKELPVQMSLLEASIKNNNQSESVNIIHKFRGSCQTCGATTLDKKLMDLSSLLDQNKSTVLALEKTKAAAKIFANTAS